MNRTDPKFSINEKVIVIGGDGKVLSNSDVVLDLEWNDEWFFNDEPTDYSGWGYKLKHYSHSTPDILFVRETALRPFPKGNGMTLTEFMDIYKKDDVGAKHEQENTLEESVS